jgi:hypothetical protein
MTSAAAHATAARLTAILDGACRHAGPLTRHSRRSLATPRALASTWTP